VDLGLNSEKMLRPTSPTWSKTCFYCFFPGMKNNGAVFTVEVFAGRLMKDI